jgi:prepilin-type processing-associated H-X9-DG protein
MYVQDYDELLAPCWNMPEKGGAGSGDGTNWFNYGGGYRTWVAMVYPYTKNLQIFHCPSATSDTALIWNGGIYDWIANIQLWPELGLNYQYLSPTVNGDWYGRAGKLLEAIASPAATVMFVDSGEGLNTTGSNEEISMVVDPPDGVNAPTTLGWGGWGTDGFLGPHGNCKPRHSLGMNVTMCDGHAKWFRPEALAQGSNWNATTTTQEQVFITNYATYMWDTDDQGH